MSSLFQKRPILNLNVPSIDFFITDIRDFKKYSTKYIRLFGVTANEERVVINVFEFYNSIKIKLVGEENIDFLSILKTTCNPDLFKKIKSVDKIEGKELIGYKPENEWFYNIRFIGERYFLNDFLPYLNAQFNIKNNIYDNVPLIQKFIIETQISTGFWYSVEKGKFTCYDSKVINVNDYKVLKRLENNISIPKLRIISFDIECKANRFDENGRSVFADPGFDPIITIGNHLFYDMNDPSIQIALQLHETVFDEQPCFWFKEEHELLEKWFEIIQDFDPDILETYNGTQFDLPYIIKRSEKLGVDQYLGVDGSEAYCYEMPGARKKNANRLEMNVQINGRINWDVMKIIKENKKLSFYSLNAVSKQILDDQKIDLNFRTINKLQDGTPENRGLIVKYCLKDCDLPHRISIAPTELFFSRYIELSRVTSTPIEWLIHKGATIKASLQIRIAANKEHLFAKQYKKELALEKYEGAVVLEPQCGFYTSGPVTFLDFNSLYPSIMRGHNLCYTTFIPKNEIHLYNPDQYHVTPAGEYFLNENIKKGLLNSLLEFLIVERGKVKVDMKKTDNPKLKAMYDSKQLALKCLANSIYGFTGASVGDIPLFEIAFSVTSYGREMILASKQIIEQHFTIANGYKQNARVIYGDTDSVAIFWGKGTPIEDAIQCGKKGAELINARFPKPFNIEMEKHYFPYLLQGKKHYAGNRFMAGKWEISVSGLATQRRDNCQYLHEVMEQCFHLMFVENNIRAALDYAKKSQIRLLKGDVPMKDLIITIELKNEPSTYKVLNPVAHLSQRMQQRGSDYVPKPGDRVGYVMVQQKSQSNKTSEKAEDPLYVIQHPEIKLDYDWYNKHQLANPLYGLFDVLPEVKTNKTYFTNGAHLQIANIGKVEGIARTIFRPKNQCIQCRKILINNTNESTCEKCKGTIEAESRIEHEKDLLKQYEIEDFDIWSFCKKCAGSEQAADNCRAVTCDKFYERYIKQRKHMSHIERLKDLKIII